MNTNLPRRSLRAVIRAIGAAIVLCPLDTAQKGDVVLALPLPADSRSTTIRWDNGRWFDGQGFRAGTFVSVDGRLAARAPARVDSVVNLGGAFVIPAMGDAHQHTLNQEATADGEIRRFLDQGVFYVMVQDAIVVPPPNVLARVNKPGSVDVVYTRAPLLHPGHALVGFYQGLAARGALGPAAGDSALDTRSYFAVSDSADLDAKWHRLLEVNQRLIKVILAYSEEHERRQSDGKFQSDSTLRMARPGVDPLLLPRIVERAHAAGRRVSVHVETAADFRAAVLAGADFVAHLPGWHVGASTGFADGDLRHWFLDTADGSEAARRNVGVITTTLPKPFLDNSRYGTAMRQVQRANLRTLARAGVRLVIGSDQGDATTPAELRHLASLGALSNLELLRAAVETTPLAIFPERRIGKLADGYEASFLVLRGDPLADIANTTRISMRVKQGQILP